MASNIRSGTLGAGSTLGQRRGRMSRCFELLRGTAFGVCAFIQGVACEHTERFDTKGPGAFCGNIVPASFVRRGFSQRVRLQLELDTDTLDTRPGTLTLLDDADGPCDDGNRFEASQIRVSQELRADAVSTLLFSDSQQSNIVGWVDSRCEGPYLVVISLMFDGSVELRLMNSASDEEGNEAGAFGVFRLAKHERSCSP